MFSRISSAHPFGVNAQIVTIECHIDNQVPSFSIVGLPDNAVKESRERVNAAIKNSGYSLGPKKITINLAPADTKKEGSAFDLAIAIGVLSSHGILNYEDFQDCLFLGELSLDGHIRPVKGSLAITIEANKRKFKRLFIPKENAEEAAIANCCDIFPIEHLNDVVDFFLNSKEISILKVDPLNLFKVDEQYSLDFSDVKGQQHVKRAMEVAATGAHNLIMIGPPGSGKTMLARRLPGILPRLTLEEALETTKIYSVAGKLNSKQGIVSHRPFRSPHHTVSDVALIGGGHGIPTPGEVSLAHHGILFLDELPEFKKSALEVLRQPMEDKVVNISRASASLSFPAQFMLVAALNPSPKGYSNENSRNIAVSEGDIQKYLSKISGPLLDRIDIHIEVPGVKINELNQMKDGESSMAIRERVERAREQQKIRFKKHARIFSNSAMTSKEIKEFCQLSENSQKLLNTAIDKLGLSARAYDRILKVSRSIADLDKSDNIEIKHLSEAIQYRSLDKLFGL